MAAVTSCENALLLFLLFLLPSPKMPPLLHPPIVQYPVGKLPTRGGSVERGNFFRRQVLWLYSGTPPYDHPVYKTTSLLRPYSLKPNVKTIGSFYYFEDPVNATTSLLRPGFYGPTVVALTGFHCIMLIY